MFSGLISSGTSHTSGVLGFLQSVLEILSSNAEFVSDKETFCKLWTAVVTPLLEHVTKVCKGCNFDV